MRKWVIGLGLAAALACGQSGFAQGNDGSGTKPFVNPDPQRYMFEDTLRPGMKGYGLTVMHGGAIEKFQVEIIDVMKNMAPGMNTILVRCSGLNLEHTGIIAGMSGSPVFIDDKMIGAIAYGWDSSKDPIGGVQPIRQMLAIPIPSEKLQSQDIFAGHWTGRWGNQDTSILNQYASRRPGWSRLVAHMSGAAQGTALNATPGWQADRRVAGLRALAAPLMVAGASARSMAFLQAAFSGSGLVPVASGSTGSTLGGVDTLGGAAEIKPGQIKLEPGSSIAIPLLSGDLDLSAIGTVTEVYDGHVYAFGHAMEAEGPSHLPIATGYIYTIMPTVQESFKMGASFQAAGALVTDEQTGIVGKIGLKPDYVPLNISVRSADGLQHRKYHFQLAVHPKYTPEILGAALLEALSAQEKLPKEFTTHITGQVRFDGATIKMDMLATNDNFNPAEAVIPVALLLDNPMQSLPLKEVNLEAQVENTNQSAQIKSISLDQTIVVPGQEIIATVELDPWHEPARKVELRLKVPTATPDGDYQLAIGSADMLLQQESESFPQRFDPENIGELVHDLQHILDYRNDRIYASLLLDPHGVAQHGQEHMDMPRTRMAMFATDKRDDALPVFDAVTGNVAAHAVALTGGQVFNITVDKDAGKRFYTHKVEPGSAGQKMQNPSLTPTTSGPETQPHQ